jgi:hypothetical protein
MNMRRLTEEEIKYLKYQIYRSRYDDPWISDTKVAQIVNHSVSTVNRYATQAVEEEVLLNPQLRLHSHPEKRGALLLFSNKQKAYDELKNHPGILYLCMYQGHWDIMAVYNGYVDFSAVSGFKGEVAEGPRGTTLTPQVEYTSWERCFKTIETSLEHERRIEESKFHYKPHLPDWDEEHWKIFNYFKFDVRRKINILRKETLISWRKYEEWKKMLRNHCTILSFYFPEGYHSYDCFTFCCKTASEKYVAELFSTLPTTSVFHKIGDNFLVDLFVPKGHEFLRRISVVTSLLIEKGIIHEYLDGTVLTSWQRPE